MSSSNQLMVALGAAILMLAIVADHKAYIASGTPVEELTNVYQRYIDFGGEDGQIVTIDLEEKPDTELLSMITMDEDQNDLHYYLYTLNNTEVAHELVYQRPETVESSPFDASKHTVVFIHGWFGHQNTRGNIAARDAYLKIKKYDVNFITYDWSKVARAGYATASSGVPAVGQKLGQFLQWLRNNFGLDLNSKVHLVGFSLGGHVAGHAGRYLEGILKHITALDAAGPLFTGSKNCINQDDAIYVEALHCSAVLGLLPEVGDADFFPNGGKSQPGCFTPVCDHNRCYELFGATVVYDHLIAKKCSDRTQLNLNLCNGQTLPMGNADINKSGSGTYRVNTDSTYPFNMK